ALHLTEREAPACAMQEGRAGGLVAPRLSPRPEVNFVTPDHINELRREKYNATVLRLTKVHSDLMLLRVRPDSPLQTHLPGQYTTLGLGFWEPRHPGCQEEEVKPEEEARIARRSYSISHPVLDDEGAALALPQKEFLEFYIVLVRESSRPQPPALT